MKQLIESPNQALMVLLIALLGTGGVSGLVSGSISRPGAAELRETIDERIDHREEVNAEAEKVLAVERAEAEAKLRASEQKLEEARNKELVAHMEQMEARIMQKVSELTISTRDRVYRHEVANLLPLIESWLEETLEPHGIDLVGHIPRLKSRPDDPLE